MSESRVRAQLSRSTSFPHKILQLQDMLGAGDAVAPEFAWFQVFTDDYIHPRDCLPSGEVKPRRPMPVIRQSELLSQLQKVGDTWILPGRPAERTGTELESNSSVSGPLNGWPSLVNLQLRSITQKQRGQLPKRL